MIARFKRGPAAGARRRGLYALLICRAVTIGRDRAPADHPACRPCRGSGSAADDGV